MQISRKIRWALKNAVESRRIAMFHVKDLNAQYHRRQMIPFTTYERSQISVLYNINHQEASKLRFGHVLQWQGDRCESCLGAESFR